MKTVFEKEVGVLLSHQDLERDQYAISRVTDHGK